MEHLRTEVARAIVDYTLDTRWSSGGLADAVIPIVLERAAEVADNHCTLEHSEYGAGYDTAAERIATAIRNLGRTQ